MTNCIPAEIKSASDNFSKKFSPLVSIFEITETEIAIQHSIEKASESNKTGGIKIPTMQNTRIPTIEKIDNFNVPDI